MSNQIWLEFADGQYLFHLTNKRIAEIERIRGRGFGKIHSSIIHGTTLMQDGDIFLDQVNADWFDADLIEVIRQGLIGGGKCVVDGVPKAVETFHVNGLIQSYIDDLPRMKVWEYAARVSYTTFEGYENPGEAEGAKAPENKEKTQKIVSSDQMDTLDTP